MKMNSPIYIAIEGVIGVGKTSLATLLESEYKAKLMLEVFEENPFLSLFYADPDRYAFQVQVAFLLSRYHQQRAVCKQIGQVPLISDYLFAKDRLFARLNLEGHEWTTYQNLHHTLAEQIILPDLVVYLRANVDTLMGRIAQRGRPYERNMPRDYIARLSSVYEHFFATYTAAPLITIDTNELNLVRRAADLDVVRQKIGEALALTHKSITDHL